MQIVWLCLAALIVLPPAASAAPVLERVVMVSRHGVRSPTRTVSMLNTLTKRDWPAWPIGAGEMTEHGAKALGLMADYLRETYAASGALPAQGCPSKDSVAVWSDVADHRTRQSGDILADRLAPGCGLVARHAADGQVDPLFDASKGDACHIGLLARGAALAAAAKEGGALLRPEDRRALEVLQTILAPDACGKGAAGLCLVPAPDASTAKAAMSLALGGTIAEGLYLEYVQGFPLPQVGWGKVTGPDTIASFMPLHARGIDILRRTPTLAAQRGATMARTIVAFLARRALPEEAPQFPPDAKLIMLAGHDSNLLYLAGLMALDWQLPNQPSPTAPDTTLAFELWHDPVTDRRTVRIVVYAQTLAQLRDATPLDPAHRPDVVHVVPDACAQALDGCPLATFNAAVDRQLASLCGGG